MSKPPISHEIIEPLLFSGGVRNKQSLNTILSKNVETTHARSMVDALRLNVELSLRQANILNEKGELTNFALSNVKILKEGKGLHNPKVITELTKDGSNISDWAKYTTKEPVILSNGQKVQVHFYRNDITGKINYNIDFKTKPVISPMVLKKP